MPAAHSQKVTISLVESWPSHPPRKSDPHYKAFTRFVKRAHKLGLSKCAVDNQDCYGIAECHHSKVEFAHIGDVDVQRFDKEYGLHLSDSEFQSYVEGEGNAEFLCVAHHRGVVGVHSLPEPQWNIVRVAKVTASPVRVQSNSEIPVVRRPK